MHKRALGLIFIAGEGVMLKRGIDRTVLCLFVALVFVLLTSKTGWSNTGDLYGCYWSGDGLVNLEIRDNRTISYRFRSEHTGQVQKVRIFFIFRAAGYYSGTGGKISVGLYRDDGSSQRLPSGSPLASATISDPLNTSSGTSNGAFRLVTLSKPVPLQKGQLYHVVFSNIDSNPSKNWVSLNCLYNPAGGTRQFALNNTDWAAVWKLSGSWTNVDKATPILQIYFDNGASQGNGYIDSWGAKAISGGNRVRETFKVTGRDRTVSEVNMRVRRTGGSGPLIVRLEASNGTLIEQGSISSVGTTMNWVTFKFRQNRTLQVGQTYHLVLSSSDGAFSIIALQNGARYGFTPPTVFPDGHAQFTTGSSWQTWAGRTDLNLQCFFSPSSAPALTHPGTPLRLRTVEN
jgi:hypothetical protein